MKTNGKVEVRLVFHVFSTVALDGHEWSALCSDRLTPGKITLDIHWKEDYMYSTTKTDAEKENKSPFPIWNGQPIHQLSSRQLNYHINLYLK